MTTTTNNVRVTKDCEDCGEGWMFSHFCAVTRVQKECPTGGTFTR